MRIDPVNVFVWYVCVPVTSGAWAAAIVWVFS